MRIVVEKTDIRFVLRQRQMAAILASPRWRREAFFGVVDAGRRTKTQVQRAVHRQMATLRYGFVAKHTLGTPRERELAFEIYAFTGGQRVEIYKGLRVLARGGDAAARFNAARSDGDQGQVRSGVWNAPRVFKRSFAGEGGVFAVLPGNRKRAPRALWTYGSKPFQPRSADGRFAPSGRTYGPIRRLHGPSLRKELPKDQSLAAFHRYGPMYLEQKVVKRMEKFVRW